MKRVIKINGKKEIFVSDAKDDFEAIRHILQWLEKQLGDDECAREKKKNYINSIEVQHIMYDLTGGKE